MGSLRPYWVACKRSFNYYDHMKLNAYLKENGITYPQFAEQSQMFSKHAVNKWCNNQRIPSKKEMLRIVEITERKVLPNDFYLGD